MVKISPLGDRLVIKVVEEETKSGIVLPDTASKDRPKEGIVEFVGPGKVGDDNKRIEMSVKKGDKVLFREYAPTEVKIENEDYLILSEGDILAIVE